MTAAEPIHTPTGCRPWCARPGIEHDHEGPGDHWWHILPVGVIPVLCNEFAEDDAPHDVPFEVEVSAYGEHEPTVDLHIQGWGDTVQLTAGQARHAAEVFARAAQLAGGTGIDDRAPAAGARLVALPAAPEVIGERSRVVGDPVGAERADGAP